MKRALPRVVLVVVLVVVLLYAAGGWYFSGRINSGALAVRHPDDKTVEVLDVTEDSITVQETDEDLPALEEDMTYGLAWDNGYGEVYGPPSSTSGAESDRTKVTRSFHMTAGDLPATGDTVRVDRDQYPPEVDPSTALGLDVQEVQYTSPAGRFDAWYVPSAGSDETDWVVLVHGGLGSDRTEALRAMDTTTKLGLPSLAIAYRNDAGAPQDDSGRYQYGRTEWRDLDGAVRYALDHGATGVTMVGDSMGGAITAAFLERSDLSSKVTRVVLDSPNLGLRGTVEYGAEQLRLPVVGSPPSALVWVAEKLAAARYDVDWDAVDYLDDTSWVRVPTLVFQGTDDKTAPMAAAAQLRDTHPELVTLVKVKDVGHMEAWNADPPAYQRQLSEFLSSS
jgi:uncharacterized protein